MSLKHYLSVVALVLLFSVPLSVVAQVPVEVSTEKVMSGGRSYYMHEVQKNQTLYSISKAYRVPIAAIERENVIPPNGIQTGQVLRVPAFDDAASTVVPRPAAQPDAAVAPRPAARPTEGAVTRTETRPAPRSDVPHITISNERIVTGGRTYFMHEVKRGETLYSLARAYRVTILDIDRENVIPPGGIQAGQVLKIPAVAALIAAEEEQHIQAAEAGRQLPRQEEVTRQTQPPRQETPARQAQPPRQETPVVKEEAPAKAAEPEKAAQPEKPKEQPAVQPAPVKKEEAAGVQTGRSDTGTAKPAPVKPERKKIHKVQKGESLASIAKKYGISVQDLKKANRGVIFAMPDMRLVIPVPDEEDTRD